MISTCWISCLLTMRSCTQVMRSTVVLLSLLQPHSCAHCQPQLEDGFAVLAATALCRRIIAWQTNKAATYRETSMQKQHKSMVAATCSMQHKQTHQQQNSAHATTSNNSFVQHRQAIVTVTCSRCSVQQQCRAVSLQKQQKKHCAGISCCIRSSYVQQRYAAKITALQLLDCTSAATLSSQYIKQYHHATAATW